MYTTKTDTDKTVTDHDFNVCDARGRAIGARVLTCVSHFVTGGSGSQYAKEPGWYYALWVSALRGGAAFGAIQPMRYFATAELRDAAVAKYLAGARKRAAKLGGE